MGESVPGEEDGEGWILGEWLEGGSLKTILGRN